MMLKQFLILIFAFTVSHDLQASSHITINNTSECDLVVQVLDQKSYNKGTRNVFSIFEAEVIEILRCDRMSPGDHIRFAAPGGVFGNLETRINGIEIEKGREHYVALSPTHERLGIPILIRSQVIKNETSTNQSNAFVCSRVGSSGPSLFWAKRSLVMHPVVPDNSSIGREDLLDAMEWASKQWSQSANSDFQFIVGEPVQQKWTGFDWSLKQQNYNIVIVRNGDEEDFYSEWLHESRALAITSLTFIRQSGEIVDADIELNAANYNFTNCHPGENCLTLFDLKSTLTHEYGHVLGLDHPDPESWRSKTTTMYEKSASGETSKRQLSKDDIRGLDFLYPKGSATRECFGVARRFPSSVKVSSKSGCSQSASTNAPTPIAILLILLGLRLLFRFIVSRIPGKEGHA